MVRAPERRSPPRNIADHLAAVFIDWGRRVRAAGITIPIVPGIMPIQTYSAFKRRTDFAKTIIPQALWDLLEPIKDDDAKVREVGTQYVADMCRKIMAADIGINGIHCCEYGQAVASVLALTATCTQTL